FTVRNGSWTLKYPQVVMCIDSQSTDLSRDPLIRQSLRPQGVRIEPGRLRLGRPAVLRRGQTYQQANEDRRHPNPGFHTKLLRTDSHPTSISRGWLCVERL